MVREIRLLRVFWVCGKLLLRYCWMLLVFIDSLWLEMEGVVCVLIVVVISMVEVVRWVIRECRCMVVIDGREWMD